MDANTRINEVMKAVREEWGTISNGQKMTDPQYYWYNFLIPPLAEALAEVTGLQVDQHGPFGLGARVWISFFPMCAEVLDHNTVMASICFEPTFVDEVIRLWVVDFTNNTGNYEPDTIGELNGFNFRPQPLPETLGDLIEMYAPELAVRL